ncbi:MAG: lysophospholipid acyltransferase family protein [Desulfovibrio sp.]|nr:lysophospholipid acyltransferase family protein [Desulfovibrio sp.]
MKIPPALVAPLINGLYRLWCASLTVVETGREAVDVLEADRKPMMFSLWHDELFTLMHVRRSLRLVTVVSQSRDGEYLARLLQSLGLRTARGSSSRGALGALLQAARIMREEACNGVLTLDGPRGPRHVAKQGAIILAYRTPAYLVPVRLFPRKAKVFGSWDRFQLPLPFSRVDIVFGAPYLVAAQDLSDAEVEKEALELEQRLHALRPPDLNDHG